MPFPVSYVPGSVAPLSYILFINSVSSISARAEHSTMVKAEKHDKAYEGKENKRRDKTSAAISGEIHCALRAGSGHSSFDILYE